jgi:hypothetical protein
MENISFAVPINLAKAIMPQLIESGRVLRPWTGIRGRLIMAEEFREIFNVNVVDGLMVETVDPGSPANEAGLRGGELPVMIAGEDFLLGGDIIFSINGHLFQNGICLRPRSPNGLGEAMKASLPSRRPSRNTRAALGRLPLFRHLSLNQGTPARGLLRLFGLIGGSFSFVAFGLAEGCGLHPVLDSGDCGKPSLRLPDFPSQMPEPGVFFDFLFFQSPAMKFSQSFAQGLFIILFSPLDRIMCIT